MKNTSRILSAFLSLLLIVGCLPLSAGAEETNIPSGKCGENVTWRIQDDTLFISGTGAMEDYYPTEEKYPAYLSPLYNYSKIVVEDGVTSVGAYAFMDIYALLGGVGDNKLFDDDEPTDDILSGPNIESISLPKSVTKVGDKAFFMLLSLKEIIVDNDNPNFAAKDCVLYDKDIKTLYKYPSAKEDTSFETPQTVETIESYAFFGYQNLASITLTAVNRIESGAIMPVMNNSANVYVKNRECKLCEAAIITTGKICGYKASTAESYAKGLGLKFRDIEEYPATPTTGKCGEKATFEVRDNTLYIRGTGAVDGYDIYDCDCEDYAPPVCPYFDAELMYNHIVVEEGITSIGSFAFYNKNASGPHYEIKTLSLPKSLKTLDELALGHLNDMESITVASDSPYFAVQNHALYSKKIDTLYLYLNTEETTFKVPATVKTIVSGAISSEEGLQKIYIQSDSITILDNGITMDMDGVVYLPRKVHLSEYAMDCGTIYGYCGTDAQYYADDNCIEFVSRGHVYSKYTPDSKTKATLTKNGKAYKTCAYCGAKDRSKYVTLNKIGKITLSTTKYTYNGKVKTPTVTVKDSKGKTLKKNTDYTVKYANGRKKVGKYSVKITFRGNYSGSKTLYFTINPKGTKLKSVTARKKGFKAKWSAQKSQTSGYQIQYSTSKKFKSAKTVTISGNKNTSKTVKKLKAGKKYYVRVRTYKTVGKTKFYSSWSGYKSAKTKK